MIFSDQITAATKTSDKENLVVLKFAIRADIQRTARKERKAVKNWAKNFNSVGASSKYPVPALSRRLDDNRKMAND